MGMRSLIVIQSQYDEPVTIYSHWGGVLNLSVVKDVMARTSRNDSPYLAAQLFYEFATRTGYEGNLGMGIIAGDGSSYLPDRPTVYVHAEDQTYTYDGITYSAQGEEVLQDA